MSTGRTEDQIRALAASAEAFRRACTERTAEARAAWQATDRAYREAYGEQRPRPERQQSREGRTAR
jgi:hypothetical protein